MPKDEFDRTVDNFLRRVEVVRTIGDTYKNQGGGSPAAPSSTPYTFSNSSDSGGSDEPLFALGLATFVTMGALFFFFLPSALAFHEAGGKLGYIGDKGFGYFAPSIAAFQGFIAKAPTWFSSMTLPDLSFSIDLAEVTLESIVTAAFSGLFVLLFIVIIFRVPVILAGGFLVIFVGILGSIAHSIASLFLFFVPPVLRSNPLLAVPANIAGIVLLSVLGGLPLSLLLTLAFMP